jgi:hypothetical protein
MIIQTIKAWLNKLFAWWPWKRAPAPKYPQAASQVSKGITQEQIWRAVREGPMPQSGVRSVVVEHGVGPNSLDTQPQPLVGDELSGRMSPPAMYDEQPAMSRPLSGATGKDIDILSEAGQIPEIEYEQQLGFLRYLVQQGVINEGFAEGQVPVQYQSKQEG